MNPKVLLTGTPSRRNASPGYSDKESQQDGDDQDLPHSSPDSCAGTLWPEVHGVCLVLLSGFQRCLVESEYAGRNMESISPFK